MANFKQLREELEKEETPVNELEVREYPDKNFMITVKEFQERFEEAKKYIEKSAKLETLKTCEKIVIDTIAEYEKMLLVGFDKPKELCPIVTWNYSCKFSDNILKDLKQKLGISDTDKTKGEKE